MKQLDKKYEIIAFKAVNKEMTEEVNKLADSNFLEEAEKKASEQYSFIKDKIAELKKQQTL